MKKFSSLICLSFLISVFSTNAENSEKEKPFTFLLAMTRQDQQMDWWQRIPYHVPAMFSLCEKVTRGEIFQIFPTFNYIGRDNNEANVTWSIKVFDPIGNVSQNLTDIVGLKGKVQPKGILISTNRIVMTMKEENAYGTYQLEVTAVDHILEQEFTVHFPLELIPFQYKPDEIDENKWFIEYPINPRPRDALYYFTHISGSIFEKKGRINHCIWFYKSIYENNPFLIEPTLDFYRTKASKTQKKEILLLFHLLGKTDSIEIEKKLQSFAKDLEKIHFPDPYKEITTGNQLDMLWSEYFATARIKPIEHFLSVFELGIYAGTLDKVEAGELNRKDPVVIEAAKANAVLNSAIWSLKSNCLQSRLLFHYCIELYETSEFTELQKSYLAAILNFVSKELKKETKE